jgi:putative ABC transport system substrate-binding protein
MKRRQLLLAGAFGAIVPLRGVAQSRSAKIGLLGARPLSESVYAGGIVRAFTEFGYRDIEYRSADGFADRYPKLARELIDLKCSLIVAFGPEQPARALQDARSPVPVVILAVDYDPVEKAIIASLRRPDRNTTGVYLPQNQMVAKRIEVMREILPAARRFLVLVDIFSKDQVAAARAAAAAARVDVTLIEFATQPYDYPGAFDSARKEGAEALVTLSSPVFATDATALSVLALKHRIPSIGSTVQQVATGFLLSFNADPVKATRRVAEIGVRILNGTKAEQIPVEQADEFELAVNARTARSLGLKIPESVLARATRIIT